MRNGKHESNAPSRFLREIDKRYLANPLRDEDFRARDRFADEDGESPRFGGFGGRFSPRGAERRSPYGTSSKVTYEPSRPSAPKPAASARVVRPSVPVPPRTPDPDFVPMSVLDMKAGMRIEHNRFGYGVIKEISGSPSDLKATIAFDTYGEKILLLKYAKIRPAGK